MRKLIFITLFILPVLSFAQDRSITMQFRTQDPSVSRLDSVWYTFTGKVGGVSYLWNAEKQRSYFLAKRDSALFVTPYALSQATGGSSTVISIPIGSTLSGGFAIVSYSGSKQAILQRVESGHNDTYYPEIRKYPTQIWVYLGDVDDGTGHTNWPYQLVLR